jgi:hypothetical protein
LLSALFLLLPVQLLTEILVAAPTVASFSQLVEAALPPAVAVHAAAALERTPVRWWRERWSSDASAL